MRTRKAIMPSRCPTDESGCYSLQQVAECAEPLLGNVSCAVILTMSDSPRHEKLDMATLSILCPRLYLQCNRGYRRCDGKPLGVTNSAHDLAHAYMSVFEHFEGEAGYVLVLEDDVIFDTPELPLHLGRVNEFLGAFEGCSLYTLGSLISWMVPFKGGGAHHRRILGQWFTTHAVIWSSEARGRLMRKIRGLFVSPSDDIVHMDHHPENRIGAYAYYKAIATQIFPQTENCGNWCSACKNVGSPRARRANRRHRKMTKAAFRTLKLNSKPRPGWDVMYGFGFGYGGGTLLLLLLVVVCSALLCFVIVKATRMRATRPPATMRASSG